MHLVRAEPLTCYRDFLETNIHLYTASYPWMVNRGVFMTPGDERAMDPVGAALEDHVDRYVDAFATFAAELTR